MNLSELKKNESGKIISVNCEAELKARFSSFGITRGSIIHVIEHTIRKNTIEVQINTSKIALRLNEAQLIEIEKVKCEK